MDGWIVPPWLLAACLPVCLSVCLAVRVSSVCHGICIVAHVTAYSFTALFFSCRQWHSFMCVSERVAVVESVSLQSSWWRASCRVVVQCHGMPWHGMPCHAYMYAVLVAALSKMGRTGRIGGG